MTKAQLKLLLLTFYSFHCPKILLHIFTGETLLFKWSVVWVSQVMYFWRYFPLNFAIFMVPHKQFESEEIQNSVKKSDVDQITKTAYQRIKKDLLVSNNGFLPGFITFSLYGKLLKMCSKMAADSPLRGAKPRWSPQP